jgi:ABC-type transporter Mla subunit MlaD
MTEIKPPGKFQRAVRRTGRRLEDHRLAAGLAVSAVGAVLAWVAWASVNGVPLQPRYQVHAVVSADAPIVKPGDAVRIAGRLAGIVTGVDPHHGSREVTMDLRPGFAPIGRNARVRVTVKSIVYLTYVSILPGNLNEPMAAGGTIPLRRTGSGVGLLEVVQLFDKQARRALSKASFNAGIGLAGRGPDLNGALHDLPPLTRNGASELKALTSKPGAIARSIAATERVVSGLAGARPDDVRALLRSGSAVLGAVANQQGALGRSLDLLRPFEDQLLATAPLADPVLSGATTLTRKLRPAVVDLAAALPDLNRALALGDVLRRQTHRLTSFLRPIIRAATPVIASLEPTVASINPLLNALGRLVDTITPYRQDFVRAGHGLVAATTLRYPQGQTAPNNPALRFAPVLTCAKAREPYPAPNTTRSHSQSC